MSKANGMFIFFCMLSSYISEDMALWEESKMWLFSCYAFQREVCCLPGEKVQPFVVVDNSSASCGGTSSRVAFFKKAKFKTCTISVFVPDV